jgi:hypothetical protein
MIIQIPSAAIGRVTGSVEGCVVAGFFTRAVSGVDTRENSV